MNTAPISGTMELLPDQQAKLSEWKHKIHFIASSREYKEIETPLLERLDFLLAKEHGETSKQIYQVLKTGETTPPKQGLRFDNTIPLIRYILEHENDLRFPLKTFQLNKCFRGERAQKGRYREFYQADFDIIKRTNLTEDDDAQIIDTIGFIVYSLTKQRPEIHISNRKIIQGLIQELHLEPQGDNILGIIDHADKLSERELVAQLAEVAGGTNATVIHYVITSSDTPDLNIGNELYNQGLLELIKVKKALEQMSLYKRTHPYKVVTDLKIVRGLNYYTGTVFETTLEGNAHSVASGGRYDNLSKLYSNRTFSGTGGAVGLTRLFSTTL
jgi:histidyl-tRNA synthetase